MKTNPITDAAELNKSVRESIVKQCLYKIQHHESELQKWRVVCGIYTLLFEHYDRLIDAYKRSFPQHTIAYHSRCLLELLVWTKFALESDDNIRKIHADTLNDSMDLLSKLKSFSAQSEGLLTVNFINQDTRLKEIATREGHEEPTNNYLHTSNLLSDKNQREYYLTYNKILSKIIHPSGFSIIKTTNDAIDSSITDEIVKTGCQWFLLSIKSLSVIINLEVEETIPRFIKSEALF